MDPEVGDSLSPDEIAEIESHAEAYFEDVLALAACSVDDMRRGLRDLDDRWGPEFLTPPEHPVEWTLRPLVDWARCILHLELYRHSSDLTHLETAVAQSYLAVLGLGDREDGVLLRDLHHGWIYAARGNALLDRYDRGGPPGHLDEAVYRFEQAVELAGAEESQFGAWLAHAHYLRWCDGDGTPADLDAAIDGMADALRAAGPDGVHRGMRANNLGSFHLTRFEDFGRREDIKAALEHTAEAVRYSEGYPDSCAYLLKHAHAMHRAHDAGHGESAGAVSEAFRRAVSAAGRFASPQGPAGAEQWLDWAARRGEWAEAAEAGQAGIAIVETLLDRQLHDGYKEVWLGELTGLFGDAAHALARAGRPEEAVVAAERGRAVILSDRFPDTQIGLEEVVDFAGVRRAAVDAPLVYLIAAHTGGLALIVTADGAPRAVELPDLTWDRLHAEFETFGRRVHAERGNGAVRRIGIDAFAGWLGRAVMGPLLAQLPGVAEIVALPFGLLALAPLHAAWWPVGDARRYAVQELAIGYAPSARTLLSARRRACEITGRAVLAIAEPQPVSARPLPAAVPEADMVLSQLPGRVLTGPEATIDAVLAGWATAQVLHFACHGEADTARPMDSALLLAGDERLSLDRLLDAGLPEVRLVTLSACQTNVGGTRLPDEANSLAAGLAIAAAGGVLGSLWRVDDAAAAELMARFYVAWHVDGQPPVRALRVAQLALLEGEPATWRHPYFWAGFSLVGG
ncbi:CHAT domain-containing protein [Longispora sp. K20-0274]|uniref:CHAT domain-containing protein n=1 Tax=Longispora sp. K20-0274 TaxID=3088255 RepID=UPI0039997AB1